MFVLLLLVFLVVAAAGSRRGSGCSDSVVNVVVAAVAFKSLALGECFMHCPSYAFAGVDLRATRNPQSFTAPQATTIQVQH